MNSELRGKARGSANARSGTLSSSLKNGNERGDPTAAPRCGAKTRRGTACHAPAMRGKRRCRLHGGMSTGPRTSAGLARIRAANTRHGRYSAGYRALRRIIRDHQRRAVENARMYPECRERILDLTKELQSPRVLAWLRKSVKSELARQEKARLERLADTRRDRKPCPPGQRPRSSQGRPDFPVPGTPLLPITSSRSLTLNIGAQSVPLRVPE